MTSPYGSLGVDRSHGTNLQTTKNTTTLPETNSSPPKMDGWNTTFLLGRPIFRGHVSFRECRYLFLAMANQHFAEEIYLQMFVLSSVMLWLVRTTTLTLLRPFARHLGSGKGSFRLLMNAHHHQHNPVFQMHYLASPNCLPLNFDVHRQNTESQWMMKANGLPKKKGYIFYPL